MAAAAIPAIASIVGPLLSGLLGSNAQGEAREKEEAYREWLKNFGISQLDKAQSQYFDPVRDGAINMMNLYGNMLSGGPIELIDSMNNRGKGNMDLFRQMAYGIPPGVEEQNTFLKGLQGGAGNVAGTAAQLFQGGGWAPARQDFNDRLADIIAGRGIGNSNAAMGDIGMRLLQDGGTNFTRNTQDRASDTLNAGGMNPYLDAGMASALGIANSGGRTDLTSAGLPLAMQMLSGAMQSGGATPYTNAMQDRGLNLANREALLPTEMAMAMAGDTAASGFDKQRERLITQALQRGGGPGNIVAAGAQTGATADFEDERLKAITDAQRNALLGQQGLGLQQMGIGSDLAGSGASVANQRFGQMLGTGGNMLTGLGGLENERLLGGLGTIASLNNSATQRAGTMGNLGLGAGQLDLSRMGLGGQLTQNNTENLLRSLGLLESGTTNQQNVALGGGNLFNQLLGTQGNLSNSISGNNFNAGNLGLNQYSTLFNSENALDQNKAALYSQMANLYLNGGMAPMMNMGNMFGNLMSNSLGQMGAPNPMASYGVQSPWAGALAGIGGGLGGVMQAMGGGGQQQVKPFQLPMGYGF